MKNTTLVIIVSFISFIGSFNSSVFAQKNFIDTPYIETSAKADTSVTPDKIYISINLSERDNKGKTDLKDIEKAMYKALKSSKIDLEKQLKVSDMFSDYKKYFLKKDNIQKAISYELCVYSAKKVGEVLYKLEEVGISNTQVIRTDYSKIEKIKLELKKEAILKAKRNAIVLSNALNQKIGMPLFISDGYSNVYNNYKRVNTSMRVMSDSKEIITPQPNLDFEKIKIETNISVKFKLINNVK